MFLYRHILNEYLIYHAFKAISKIKWKWISVEKIERNLLKNRYPRKDVFVILLLNSNMSIFWINTSLAYVMFHFKFPMCVTFLGAVKFKCLFLLLIVYTNTVYKKVKKKNSTAVLSKWFSAHFSLNQANESVQCAHRIGFVILPLTWPSAVSVKRHQQHCTHIQWIGTCKWTQEMEIESE